mmetsp:Transcript_44371/g.100318  ORF Transcript_44371/g.100318 Transcript_44371/m.100318 type:complete len:222 (+) Transcript_44371:203-868(+)
MGVQRGGYRVHGGPAGIPECDSRAAGPHAAGLQPRGALLASCALLLLFRHRAVGSVVEYVLRVSSPYAPSPNFSSGVLFRALSCVVCVGFPAVDPPLDRLRRRGHGRGEHENLEQQPSEQPSKQPSPKELRAARKGQWPEWQLKRGDRPESGRLLLGHQRDPIDCRHVLRGSARECARGGLWLREGKKNGQLGAARRLRDKGARRPHRRTPEPGRAHGRTF